MRLMASLEIAKKTFLFFWHELFAGHDPRVVKTRFLHGRRLLSLECDCGAEWDDIDVTDSTPELG